MTPALLKLGIRIETGIDTRVGNNMAGRIIIETERCKGCGLCVTVCPKNSIVISAHSNRTGFFPAEFTSDDCTGCTACAIICPDAIIEVYCDRPTVIEKSGEKNKATLTEEKV